MRLSTSLKLLAVAFFALFFAGFLMRAALKLANAAMHSFFVFGIIVILAVWILGGMKKDRSG
jgi:hypothetical protein